MTKKQIDPFEGTELSEDCKRERAMYYVVQEVVFEGKNTKSVTEFLRDNYKEGMTIVKGFKSVPIRKETYSF